MFLYFITSLKDFNRAAKDLNWEFIDAIPDHHDGWTVLGSVRF